MKLKFSWNNEIEGRRDETMGKDRQEKKLRQSRTVESDRDQNLKYSGATRLESAEEARQRNK
jgi:hypothetical protein